MRLIKFEQPNCAPCRAVDQFFKDSEVPADKLEKIMAFNAPEKAAEFGIMSVPVTILLDDQDQEVGRSVGYKPVELRALVEKLG